nr:RNA-directed DNA polymerase, eukaryota [Tanacetum cinerariifolium]
MIKHKGVLSWFLDLLNANNNFVSDEQIVWVDLEGIPLNAWSCETFIRIGKLWGWSLILENDIDNSFGHNGEVHSEDPFGVYDLLEKNKKVVGSMISPSLSHPPGFTPVASKNNNINNNANNVSDCNAAHTTSTGADNIDPKPQVDAP